MVLAERFGFRICRGAFIAAAAAIVLAGCGDSRRDANAVPAFVTIGTGGVTGVYYPAGGAIARLVNRKRETHGFRMSVEATGGSVFNINAVLAGDMEFGIAQSDRQYQAAHGLAEWKAAGPRDQLRAVCSLHPEIVTLVAADDSGIAALADLKGKRVNLGNPGSGQRGNALDVLRAAGIDADRDIVAEGLKASECPQKLQDGRIEAFFYTVGHPAAAIMEATSGQRRTVHFVPIVGMDKLLAAAPYYSEAAVPVKLYPKASSKQPVPSIGVMTTIVTSAKVPDKVVHAVVKELMDNLDDFKQTHPAFEDLTKEGMLRGLSAPIHPGAMKYFREAGLK